MASWSAEVAQPRMLVLARESRGWKQGDVATTMKELDGEPNSRVSQAYVSRAESGKLAVSGDRLELYASALGYPPELLTLDRGEVGAGVGLVHHRKKQAVTAPELRRIHALLNLTRIQLAGLVDGAPRSLETKIPQVVVDDYTSPEEAADVVRADWGVPRGPFDSVLAALEAAGGLIMVRPLLAPSPLDSGHESVPVDAVSNCTADEDPIVLLNAGTPADRQRFTLAHELGHMVMHAVPHPDQEKQANRFAAQLLMPARDIRPSFKGSVNLPLLLALKEQWRVSMWALLRRAHTLGEISDWQYRTLAVEMTSLGYRTTEPSVLELEQPSAVRAVIDWRLAHGSGIDALARATLLRSEEFTRLYLDSTSGHPIPTITAEVSK